MQSLSEQLFEIHNHYLESKIQTRRFGIEKLEPLLLSLNKGSIFKVEKIGKSVENRPIYLVKAGTGPIKILLWSQMHGNEPTATMALLDIFNFLKSEKVFKDIQQSILSTCTLYFVPMLNPDGADRFIRRNALGVDMNRDALRTVSPESVLLKKLQNDLQPKFAFNLHDQNPRYSIANGPQQAAVSFLATAYNADRSINEVRKKAMQLVVNMNQGLQKLIPGKIGRYSDEFEPRAFGDNIQKWGSSLVLIESGGYKNDPEKQQIRKLNFICIIEGLYNIANQSLGQVDINEYEKIPEIGKPLFDVLIRNAEVELGGKRIIADFGINIDESPKGKTGFKKQFLLDDFGDLSTFFGINEINAEGCKVVPKESTIIAMDKEINIFIQKNSKVLYTLQKGVLVKQ